MCRATSTRARTGLGGLRKGLPSRKYSLGRECLVNPAVPPGGQPRTARSGVASSSLPVLAASSVVSARAAEPSWLRSLPPGSAWDPMPWSSCLCAHPRVAGPGHGRLDAGGPTKGRGRLLKDSLPRTMIIGQGQPEGNPQAGPWPTFSHYYGYMRNRREGLWGHGGVGWPAVPAVNTVRAGRWEGIRTRTAARR